MTELLPSASSRPLAKDVWNENNFMIHEAENEANSSNTENEALKFGIKTTLASIT